MNTEHTLLNNPFVNSIFEIVGKLNVGLMNLALVAIIGWYSYTSYTTVNYLNNTVASEYNLNLTDKKFLISSVCQKVIVDAADNTVVASRMRDDSLAKECVHVDDVKLVDDMVSGYAEHSKFMNGSDDVVIYAALFILTLSYAFMTMLPLILTKPLPAACAITLLWLAVSLITFPLNFGSRTQSYTHNVGIYQVVIQPIVTNNSNSEYIVMPHGTLGRIMYVRGNETPSEF